MPEPVTREDLERMTEGILRELRSSEERILRRAREEVKHSAESIVNLIKALSERMDKRFEALEWQLKSAENRIDRLGETTAGLLHQFTGFTRWAEQLDKNDSQILAARVSKLEQPLPPAPAQ